MELLLSKLQPPREQPDFLERPRLLNCSDVEHKRIITITAPAGYGKTVLLLQLCRYLQRPLLWYHLDQYDNDPATFLNYLAAGLQVHNNEAGKQATALAGQPGGTFKNQRFAVAALLNGISAMARGFTIALDDYHCIEEKAIHSLIQEIADNLPDEVCLTIASRKPLPLSFSRLKLSGQVLELGWKDICFNSQEVSKFLRGGSLGLGSELIEKVTEVTEGWPAAVRLARGLDGRNSQLSAEAWENNVNRIYPYLAAEVMEKQPAHIQHFLMVTSVLDILEPSSCDQLLGRTDSTEILKTLSRQQLFINPLSQRGTYCYHQLFQEFLQDGLGKNRDELLRKAGKDALKRGETNRAVKYMLQAGSSPELFSALRQASWDAMAQGQWQTVLRWLDNLTDKEIQSDPWLSLYKAQVEIQAGRHSQAEDWVNLALDGLLAANDLTGVQQCRILKSHLHRSEGNYQESLDWLEQVQKTLPSEQASSYFTLPLEIAYSQMLMGRMAEAEDTLNSALTSAKTGDNVFLIAHIAEALGNVLYLQGKHAGAVKIYQWSMHLLPEHNLPGYFIQDLRAYIYKDWGELEKALEYARRSVQALERIGLSESLPSAYSALGYVLFELGHYEEVERYSLKAVEMMTKHGGERYFLFLNKMTLAWSILHLGRWVEARQIIQEVMADVLNKPDTASALCRLLAGIMYAEMGSLKEAKGLLLESVARLKQIGYATRVCDGYKALAWVSYVEKEQNEFHLYAEQFLKLAADLNYLCSHLRATAELMQPILCHGLEKGVETVFTQRILVQMGELAVPLLEEMVSHPDPDVRCRLVPPLAEIGGKKAQAALAALTEDNNKRVHRAARLASGHTGLLSVSEPALMIKTLGAFQVSVNGKTMSGWRTQKTRDLLAYLAHMEEPVTRGAIAEELWPDYPEEKAFALFRTTLYYLRTALNSDFILYNNGRYSLKQGAVSLDCREFEQKVSTVLTKVCATEADISFLEKVITSYRGKYMDELDYLWVIPKQVRLARLYIDALLYIASFCLAKDKPGKAASTLLRVVEADPYSEQAYKLLMTAYARMGNLWEVKRTYHNLKKALADELGVTPSSDTTDLYRNVCRQE